MGTGIVGRGRGPCYSAPQQCPRLLHKNTEMRALGNEALSTAIRSPMQPPTLLRTLFLFLALSFSSFTRAQEFTFKVGDHPQPSAMSEAEFKQRVAAARNEKVFKDLLRKAFGDLREGVIDYMMIDADGRGIRMQYSASTRHTAKPRAATMATRGNEVVRSRAEFERLFADTLVVVGKLRVRLGLTNDAFTARGFTLYWTTPGAKAFRHVVAPIEGDALVLEADLLGAVPGEAIEVVLKNDAVPDAILGHCILIFMPETGQRELRRAMCRWKEEEPDASLEQQLDRAASLVEQFHGRPYPPNLTGLLCP